MRVGSRRMDVQGLRAVAVIMVVAYHAGLPVPGGFTGVDVFFVISGFVIAGLILREAASLQGFSFRRFYTRRFRRLLPALAVVIGVITIGSLLVQSPASSQRATGRSGVAAALSFANWDIYRTTGGYFDTAADSNPLLHTWSLSVEEQFYLVFPLLVIAALALSRRLTRSARGRTVLVAAMFTVVGLVSFGLAIKLMGGASLPGVSLPQTFAFYASPSRAWEFVAGVLVAVLLPGTGRLPRWLAEVLGVIGVLLLGLTAARFTAASGVPGAVTLIPVTGTVALIAAGGGSSSATVSRLLSRRPMVRIGDLSYSIYLWHWPAIVFARLVFGPSRTVALLAAAVSLLPAWASYRYLEEPIHRGRRLASWSGLRLAATCVVSAVVLAAAPYSLVKVLPGGTNVDAYLAAAGNPAERTCEYESVAEAVGGCLITAGGGTKTVYLLGDSHAGHFAAGVVASTQKLGWTTRVQTWNACPFITPGCGKGAPSVAWLVTQPPGIVVLGLQSDGYVQGPQPVEQRIQIWATALREFAEPLVAAGHSVLLMHPTPNYGNWDPRDCLGVRVYRDAAGCGKSIDRAESEKFRAPAVAAEQEVAQLRGVQVADFYDRFCDARRCYTNRGTDWYAADGDHLTVAASTALERRFTQLFLDATEW